MTQTIQQPTTTADTRVALEPRKLTAHDEHAARGANFRAQDGWIVPANYGDARAEYDSVRDDNGAGVIDLSHRGRIEVAGSEAVTFLNGMVTNDIAKLETGAWMPLAFPNVQGRLVALARVFKTSDQTFLFDTESATHAAVLKLLQRFTLAGDFRVTDRTDDLACISVQGAASYGIVNHVLGIDAADIAPQHVAAFQYHGLSYTIARATHTGETGYDVFINPDAVPDLIDRLLDAGSKLVGHDALGVLRIEAGIPRHGVDVTDVNVVLEVHQPEAVSFTKGCYVGQEIIARIHWRGHVAKRLAGVEFDGETDVPANAALVDAEGKPAGAITSPVFSPARGRTIALAMIRYAHLTPGTTLNLADDASQTIRVVELPFVRGTWHAAATTTNETQPDAQEPTR